MQHIADALGEKIMALKAPVVVGLDPALESMPEAYFAGLPDTLEGAAAAIYDFNQDVIDAVAGIAPAVKPQMAFYEMLGHAGVRCFEETTAYAKRRGLFVIEDSKRNDIGNTAKAYAAGHLGQVKLRGASAASPYGADFLTVSPFLGDDSLEPFIRTAIAENKGIFVLVRTSNKGGGMVQYAKQEDGHNVSESLAVYLKEQAQTSVGTGGYSAIGAVVGATFPKEAKTLRALMPQSLLLVPGYGAQGGGAADVAPCFCPDGLGAIVNSSRGILYAYQKTCGENCTKEQYRKSVAAAAREMQQEIYGALKAAYPDMKY
ncbi:MAG: orotidine-5'-phosphate decarboxylase [Oscillospiraceae bacterium]|jgi:orotidine-5'-phosphate decarboxylase|nr:orotidine-5'-phosphate decarboxylase [Oscillospiraceae bacterium]